MLTYTFYQLYIRVHFPYILFAFHSLPVFWHMPRSSGQVYLFISEQMCVVRVSLSPPALKHDSRQVTYILTVSHQ